MITTSILLRTRFIQPCEAESIKLLGLAQQIQVQYFMPNYEDSNYA